MTNELKKALVSAFKEGYNEEMAKGPTVVPTKKIVIGKQKKVSRTRLKMSALATMLLFLPISRVITIMQVLIPTSTMLGQEVWAVIALTACWYLLLAGIIISTLWRLVLRGIYISVRDIK